MAFSVMYVVVCNLWIVFSTVGCWSFGQWNATASSIGRWTVRNKRFCFTFTIVHDTLLYWSLFSWALFLLFVSLIRFLYLFLTWAFLLDRLELFIYFTEFCQVFLYLLCCSLLFVFIHHNPVSDSFTFHISRVTNHFSW